MCVREQPCDLDRDATGPLDVWTLYSHTSLRRFHAQPDEFLNEQYALRQILYQTPRRTELFIVLTMYNVRPRSPTSVAVTDAAGSHPVFFFFSMPVQEDEVLFCRTMHGVMSASAPCRSTLLLERFGDRFLLLGVYVMLTYALTHRKHPALVRAESEQDLGCRWLEKG